MEVKRQLDVLDRQLAAHEYIAGSDYTIADMAIWPWYGALAKGLVSDAGEFLQVDDYNNVQRWTAQPATRPAGKRRRMVNRATGAPDRKSIAKGKSLFVSLDLGGPRITKKKTQPQQKST